MCGKENNLTLLLVFYFVFLSSALDQRVNSGVPLVLLVVGLGIAVLLLCLIGATVVLCCRRYAGKTGKLMYRQQQNSKMKS